MIKFHEAEWKFLSIIWDMEPVNSTELMKKSNEVLGWKKSTTYTMIKKLSERGIIKSENAIVRAIIKKEDAQRYESEAVVKKAFDNSFPAFVTAFLGNKKISREEADELKKLIEEASD